MGKYANTFVVHNKDSNQRKFIQSNRGLYYCDVSDNSKKNAFALVNTVADNEKNYSKKDVKKSYKACNFQQTIRNVSTKTLLQIADNHELKNCPMTCSSPRCPVRSHSLVCSKIYFEIIGIGTIHVKEL